MPEKRQYTLFMTKLITVWNLSYGLFQLFLAATRHSYWYFTMAVYFFLLGLGRLLAVSQKLKHRTRIRILSLERTMLGTFGEPGLEFNARIEAYTGFAAFIILLVIALNLFRAAGKED